jgi:5-methylcytosine-specific restriction protein A
MNRPCKWPGCPAIVIRGVGYCTAHQSRGQRQEVDRTRDYDAGRDPRAVAFYRSRAWLTIRRQVLSDDPVCAQCRIRFARAVDHVVPLLVDWSRRLDRANLQGLCDPCHNAKTASERVATRRSGAGTTDGTAPTENGPQTGSGTPATDASGGT